MDNLKTFENFGKRDDFTVEDGIAVQQKQLKEWEVVLKPEVHEDLVRFITKDNDKAKTGYDIARGGDMTQYVVNYHLGEKYR